MIIYTLVISFFLGIVIPFIVIPFYPEVLISKGLSLDLEYYPLLYLGLLFVLFIILIKVTSKKEIIFLKNCRENISENKVLALALIFILLLGRVLFSFFVGDSPYTLMVQNGSLEIPGVINKLINYFYIETSFRLYPLFQGLILLSLPRKYLPYFFILEIGYGTFIYSKLIIFINILAMIFIFLDFKNLWNKKKGLFFSGLFILSSIILLLVLREVFGQLRMGYINVSDVNYNDLIMSGISRIQSISSVYYTDIVLDKWLYGKTICHTIGYSIPDSMVSLPINCRNLDEPELLHYYGVSGLNIIDKDMLSLWGEPFANFGLFGILMFVFLICIVKLFTHKLGSNKYALVFSWFVGINILIAHQSWSLTINHIYVSFVILWCMQKLSEKFDNKKVDI